MNSVEKEAVLHCLKAMIDEAVCEECPLYGTTGTDHCEKDCVRLAINALSSSENPNKSEIPTGWIPVSERLPERWQLVNITIKNYDESLLTGVGYYRGSDDGTWFITAGDGEFLVEDEVIAWMPLPLPYEASPTGKEVVNE